MFAWQNNCKVFPACFNTGVCGLLMQLDVKLYPGFLKSILINIRNIKGESTVIQQRQQEAYQSRKEKTSMASARKVF